MRGLWKNLQVRFLHPLEIPALLSPILFDLDTNEKAFSCVDLCYKSQSCITRSKLVLLVGRKPWASIQYDCVLFDAGSCDAFDEEPLAEQEDKEYGEQGHD